MEEENDAGCRSKFKRLAVWMRPSCCVISPFQVPRLWEVTLETKQHFTTDTELQLQKMIHLGFLIFFNAFLVHIVFQQ